MSSDANFKKLRNGINLVPNSTTLIAAEGDIDYSVDTGLFNIFDGSGATFIVSASGIITLTNKTISVNSNHITGTANSAAQFNFTTGDLEASIVTDVELGYVSGVTSSIQAQLNSKQPGGNYITDLTGDVTATGPGSVSATLVSVGTAGTYVKVITDAKGRVISGSVAPQDIVDGGTGQASAAAAYNALSPMTAAGDIEYEITNGVAARLPIGADGKFLKVVSGLPSWQTLSALTNPMTTTGDIIYSSDNSGTAARLGIGSNGQVLEVSGGLPTWVNSTSGGGPFVIAESLTANNVVNSIVTTRRWGQSFVPTNNGYIKNIILSVSQTGGPANGPMQVDLYTNSAGSPGTLLGSTLTLDAGILTSSKALLSFEFITSINLTSGTTYFLVFNPSGVTFAGATIALDMDTSNPYPSGTAVTSTNSGSTWSNVTGDLYFYIIGNSSGLTYFSSDIINTDSSTISSGTFTTFSNSPSFTFTPSTTGIYKVYCNIPIFGSAGSEPVCRITDSVGVGVLMNESQAVVAFSTGYVAMFPIQSVYTLTAGTVYKFDIQGKALGGSFSVNGTAGQFYMFAELID